jgi:Rieske Fe-S protein
MSTGPGAARRRIWIAGGAVALGAGLGVARWVVMRPQPPAGSPLPVEIGGLAPGRLLTVEWKGRAVWILRRTADEVAALAGYESELLDPASARDRLVADAFRLGAFSSPRRFFLSASYSW